MTDIKIPDQLFCALKVDHDPDFPLGMLVPGGSDAKAKQRKLGALKWANCNYIAKTMEELIPTTKVIECVNDPQPRFTLIETRNRGRSQKTGFFLVQDPRGFIIEVSASNAMGIIAQTTLVKGVIQSHCIWGRQGKENRLVLA